MKVKDLTSADEGRRIRVTSVAPSGAEALGYVDDTERLTGQTGRLSAVNVGVQAQVEWDNDAPGWLMLASDDEVEVIG